jgi:hypothetical protein
MRRHHDPLERFVSQVHRRLTLVRLAERVGLCVAVACGAAVLLELVLIWRGESAGIVCLSAMAAGCLTGLAWGEIVRPTTLEAAMEADRQLNLHDLLGTAILLKNKPTNPWTQTVTALAQAQCRQTSPSAVVLKRWGGRAWSGVGVGALLAVTLALIPLPVAQSADRQTPLSFARKHATENDLYENGSLVADNSAKPWTAVSARPEDERTFPQGSDSQLSHGGQSPSATADNASDQSMNPSAAPGGNGTGSSQNFNAAMTLLPTGSTASGGQPTNIAGALSGGAGLTSRNAIPSTQKGGFNANPATGGHPIPPWQTSSWPAMQSFARQAIQQGRVPDEYREMVRAYFERQ